MSFFMIQLSKQSHKIQLALYVSIYVDRTITLFDVSGVCIQYKYKNVHTQNSSIQIQKIAV